MYNIILQMEQSNQKSNEDSEALRKEHEKMLEDDLNGIESKLTKQFLKDTDIYL